MSEGIPGSGGNSNNNPLGEKISRRRVLGIVAGGGLAAVLPGITSPTAAQERTLSKEEANAVFNKFVLTLLASKKNLEYLNTNQGAGNYEADFQKEMGVVLNNFKELIKAVVPPSSNTKEAVIDPNEPFEDKLQKLMSGFMQALQKLRDGDARQAVVRTGQLRIIELLGAEITKHVIWKQQQR